MIIKTEGIVLRSRPFSKTSRVLTWLTPDYGRVTTVIKGACRPKSFFLGQTDLGYRCELLFYRKEHNGVHIAREVYPLDFREGLRGNWRASVAADYVCWFAAQVTEPMLTATDIYSLLDSTLALLSNLTAFNDLEQAVARFEFRMLDLLGVAPNFDFCRDCTFTPDKRKSCRFMLPAGHLGCIHALSIHRESESSVALTPSLVEALAAAQTAARQGNAPFLADNPRLSIGIRRFLGLFICHHLDIPMLQRSTAYAWLDWDRYEKEFKEPILPDNVRE